MLQFKKLFFTSNLVLVMFLFLCSAPAVRADAESERKAIFEELDALKKEVRTGSKSTGGLKWGGYGEFHFTKTEKPGGDYSDIHRFVLTNTYDFSDWVKFQSELEFEHGLLEEGSGGELVFEQMHIDFMLASPVNIRAGRILSPLGHLNRYHEPTTFNGVERPNFDKYIVPSTWSLDGVGIFGSAGEASYEFYVTNSLDGSQFSEKDGIRGGRMHERPGYSNTAFTGRAGYNIISGLTAGLAHFRGKANNANKGANPKFEKDVKVAINTVDAQYDSPWADVRAGWGEIEIDNVQALNKFLSESCENPPCKARNIARKMNGHTIEVAVHVWPAAIKTGKLAESDMQLFVRQDKYNTQAKVAEGTPLQAADRQDLTWGLSFWPVKNFVIKADHQVTKSADEDVDAVKTTSAGLGWVFL